MKITIIKDLINPNKFHDELLEVITEDFSLQHNDESIFLNFNDITEVKTPVIENEEVIDTIISYTKKRTESEITGQDEELNDIYSDVIYQDEFDGNLLLNTIDGVIGAYDPTPYAQPITESERVYNLESAINMLIMMQI